MLCLKNRLFKRLSSPNLDPEVSCLGRTSTMLEIFRRNRFFNSLLLLPYTILVRVWLVFDAQAPPFHIKGILTDWIFGSINENSAFALFLSIIIVYFQALLINRLVIRNRLTQELTLFPGLFYILLVSFFPEYNGLSSPLIANTFVIMALGYLMQTHKGAHTASLIFTAGFWFSVAFLFYFGYAFLFPCGILGLSMLRTVKARQWVQFIVGSFTPLLLVAMLDFLFNSNLSALGAHFASQYGFVDIDIPFGLPVILQIVLFGALVVLALMNYGGFTLKKNIHVQKKVNMLYMFLFLVPSVLLVQAGIYYEEWTVLCLVLAYFVAALFARSRQLLILEVVHFAMLLCVLGLQIYALL